MKNMVLLALCNCLVTSAWAADKEDYPRRPHNSLIRKAGLTLQTSEKRPSPTPDALETTLPGSEALGWAKAIGETTPVDWTKEAEETHEAWVATLPPSWKAYNERHPFISQESSGSDEGARLYRRASSEDDIKSPEPRTQPPIFVLPSIQELTKSPGLGRKPGILRFPNGFPKELDPTKEKKWKTSTRIGEKK